MLFAHGEGSIPRWGEHASNACPHPALADCRREIWAAGLRRTDGNHPPYVPTPLSPSRTKREDEECADDGPCSRHSWGPAAGARPDYALPPTNPWLFRAVSG